MRYSDLNKEEIRRKIKSRRDELQTYEVLKRSNEIIANLKKLPEFKEATNIACYISFNNEVYTHGLIKEYVNKKRVFVPVIDRERKEIILSHLKDWKELSSGAYGILEPRKEFLRIGRYGDIQLIIVPGIAFDEKGNRIGYGGGYFDRLLKKLKAKKVALAYDFQILKEIPNEEHDVRMDVIVSEKRILRIETLQ